MRPPKPLTALLLVATLGATAWPASGQTLNQGFSAMEQGDFMTAFSALRQLERAGDPHAARMLNEIFLTPAGAQAAAPAQSRPARVVPVAAPARARLAPQRSPRPAARILPAMVHRPAPPPRALAHDLPRALGPEDFRPIDAAQADLGQLLFFDPILSGNQDISCAVCHHPSLASGDGVSLGLGTGAQGLGPERVAMGDHAASRRIPRNAPALWNLGARDVHVLFHDGRLEIDQHNPAQRLTPQGPLDYMQLDSIVAAQALFPVLSQEEMAGRPGENPIADAVYEEDVHGDTGAWARIAARVDAIPAYRAQFAALRGAEAPVQMSEIANAIAAFIETEFRADETRFDAYLREEAALSAQEGEGMRLFFGKANCASCHSGPLLSDQSFHAMGQPPIGPGKHVDDAGYTRDLGRGAISLDPRDNYAFRTPMLRNVMVRGPWGHAGAFSDIRDFLRHHIDPVAGLAAYQPQAVLPVLESAPDDYGALDDARRIAEISTAAARAMAQRPLVLLDADEIDLLVAFLHALSDPTALAGRRGVPESVPSGLSVAR